MEKFNFCDKDDARHIGIELQDGIKVHNLYIPAGGDLPDRTNNEKVDQKLTYPSEMREYFHKIPPKKSILVGIEGAFNEYLKGQNGQMLMEKIRGNEWKPVDDELSIEPVPGSDVYTSIDVNIQDVAESALLKQLREQNFIIVKKL